MTIQPTFQPQFSTFTDLHKSQNRNVDSEVRRMITALSKDEQIQVSFVPLIILQFAWIFAEKSMNLAARYKMSEYKKICRDIKESRADYMHDVRFALDMVHTNKIFEQTNMCADLLSHDLMILYFSVNQELKNCSPNITHEDVRTYAVMSVMFILYLMIHYKEMDKMLKERLHDEKLASTIPPKLVQKIFNGMTTISDVEKSFDFGNKNVNLAMEIIKKSIKQIEFNII